MRLSTLHTPVPRLNQVALVQGARKATFDELLRVFRSILAESAIDEMLAQDEARRGSSGTSSLSSSSGTAAPAAPVSSLLLSGGTAGPASLVPLTTNNNNNNNNERHDDIELSAHVAPLGVAHGNDTATPKSSSQHYARNDADHQHAADAPLDFDVCQSSFLSSVSFIFSTRQHRHPTTLRSMRAAFELQKSLVVRLFCLFLNFVV